ncbi:hypothetical protein D3C80_1254930 [compost metagenome]
MGQASLLSPKAAFLAQQLSGTFLIGAEKHRQPQAQVGDQLMVQPGQLFQADVGKGATLRGLLLLNLAQHTFDQVRG